MQIVLAADIRSESSTRAIALSTFKALSSLEEHDVKFLRMGDQIPALEAGKYPGVAINDVKHSIIIAFREIKAYALIDSTNTLIYLATDGVIESFMAFMIHRVDRVITTNFKAAYRLCAALQQLGLQTPVHRLEPWLDPTDYKVNAPTEKLRVVLRGDHTPLMALPDITLIGKNNVAGWQTVESVPDWSQYDVYVCHDIADEIGVRQAMMCGVIPVVANRLPFSEFVINGLNGYTVNTADESLAILEKLQDIDERSTCRMMTIKSAYAQMENAVWARLLVRTATGTGVENLHEANMFNTVTPTYRRWIVPKTVLEGGKPIQVPRNYNKTRFKLIELATLEEILLYFSAQRFMDVFIFAWDYGEYNAENYNRVMNLVRAIGRRGLNMYWCTDTPVPKEWSEAFKGMTILPVEEGLKKVRPPAAAPR